MNDERSLTKQIKWLKQEINNLKILCKKGVGTIAFFSQIINYTLSAPNYQVRVIVRPLDHNSTNLFGYILPVEQPSGWSYQYVTSFTFIDGVGEWTVRIANRELKWYVVTNVPCTLEIQEG